MNYIIKTTDNLIDGHQVELSFEMPYHDWCKFEKSKTYHRLIKYLEAEQKKNNHP